VFGLGKRMSISRSFQAEMLNTFDHDGLFALVAVYLLLRLVLQTQGRQKLISHMLLGKWIRGVVCQ
jgi:hypothetical protein